jgi:Ran GTPase-activating protein (RanGAP) involved in mRNA processing and transport
LDMEGWIALCAAVKSSNTLVSFSAADVDMNPEAVAMLADAIRATAAVLTRVNVLSNSIGADGADSLIEVFNQNTNLRTLLGIEEGVTEVNLSEKNVDPGQAKILAAELKASRAMAAVTDVDMSGNPITGSEWNDDTEEMEYDLDLSGVSMLFPAMTRIIKLNVSECDLGPSSMPELAKLFSDADAAAVNKVALSCNALTGGEPSYNETTDACDLQTDGKDISGVSVLFPSMTKVTELDVSNCGLGATSMPELAKLVSDATAAVKKIALSNNFLFGTKAEYSDGSGVTHDVDADQSGWSMLCDALPGSPVEELDVADIGMGVKGVTSLAKAISAGAAVAHLSITGGLISPNTGLHTCATADQLFYCRK